MNHKKIRFDNDQLLNDPPVFAEAFMDFEKISVDPRDNPLYI